MEVPKERDSKDVNVEDYHVDV
ncbi:hypothetical protein C5167_050699 [Papaver somniferum]|uniref:Uncharacterized protein n=1 Tax=Papaver somniferum TaxID=3469 RepID=A0A4Y7KQU2_PAPSO|nr:hypothetical protein C5167_050699 [Papaver somniferum]